jgi:hypothetical protein
MAGHCIKGGAFQTAGFRDEAGGQFRRQERGAVVEMVVKRQ